MSEQKKPRVFRLTPKQYGELLSDYDCLELTHIDEEELTYIKFTNKFHVIEYSAFQAAQKEIEYLNRMLADERSGDCDKDKTIRRLQSNYDALELIYKDKQTEMNDLEIELQALTLKHAALTEQQAKYDELEKLFAKLSSDAERTEELYDSLKASADKLRDALEKEMGDGGLRISEEALAEYEAWKKEIGLDLK